MAICDELNSISFHDGDLRFYWHDVTKHVIILYCSFPEDTEQESNSLRIDMLGVTEVAHDIDVAPEVINDVYYNTNKVDFEIVGPNGDIRVAFDLLTTDSPVISKFLKIACQSVEYKYVI